MIPQEEFCEMFESLMQEAVVSGQVANFYTVRSGQRLALATAWRLAGELVAAGREFATAIQAIGRV